MFEILIQINDGKAARGVQVGLLPVAGQRRAHERVEGYVCDAVGRVWLENDRRFGVRMVHASRARSRARDALPRAQVHARAGHTRRDTQR